MLVVLTTAAGALVHECTIERSPTGPDPIVIVHGERAFARVPSDESTWRFAEVPAVRIPQRVGP